MKVQRVISYFDLITDELVGEIELKNIDLNTLQSIFDPPKSDNLMYNSYEIKEKEKGKLSEYLNIKFDFLNYAYYLECFQVDSSSS